MKHVNHLSSTVDEDVVISDAQLSELNDRGFLRIQGIASPAEVKEIRETLADLLNRNVGVKQGAQFDTLQSPSEAEKPKTSVQLTNPRDFAPWLDQSSYALRAREVAKKILGPDAYQIGEFALLKVPHMGAPTPWHQDEAFRYANFRYHEITIWLALQDVDEARGCMQFVPGSHRGEIRQHQSPGGDPRSHGLELIEPPDPAKVVSCPLKAGDCTVHNGRTMHSAKPNQSDIARYAYICVFQTKPERLSNAEIAYPWLAEKHTPHEEVRSRWFRHGGFLIVGWRKFRRGELGNTSQLMIGLRRAAARFMGKSPD